MRPPARDPRTLRFTKLRGTLRVAAACVLAVSLGGLVASPELRRSLSAAGRAFVDPALVDAPDADGPKKRAEPAAPHLQLWPEADDEALDLAIAAEFTGAREGDLEGLGGVVLELAPRRLRVPVTRRTVRWVRFFAESPAGRAAMTDRLQRLGRYRHVLEDELRSAGLLEELTAVAAIESGFDPLATSHRGAAGVWQFMPATAKAYGLVIGPGIDERRSLRRATRAAASHLRDLHEHYGRWDLALAAYNAGMGRVDRAIERYVEYRDPALSGVTPAFDELVRARLLPRETADYVPQITAFAIVAANRRLFRLEGGDEHAPLATAELPVPGGTRLRTVAKAAECTVAELRELNPDLLGDRVPLDVAERPVLVPADGVERALVTFAHHARNETDEDDGARDDVRLADAAGRPSPLASALRLPMDEPRGSAFAPIGRRSTSLSTALQLLPPPANGGSGGVLWANRAAVEHHDPLAGIDLERAGVSRGRAVHDAATGGLPGGRIEEVARRLLAPEAGAPDEGLTPSLALRLLPPPPPREPERFTVAGVAVELWREEDRPKAQFALRAGDPEPDAALRGEVAHVVEAKKDQLDAVASLLRGRLRILRAERGRQVLAALRREANADRRRMVERAPYGRAWTTLADRLFPSGHPLEGTLVAARHDADDVVDAIVLDALRPRSAGAAVTLRVEGDLHRDQVRAVVERAMRGFDGAWVDDAPIAGHRHEEIVEVELPVPDPRLLVGWIAPAEGTADEAATRVALELLIGTKAGRLRAELVERRELAETATGRFEGGSRAGVAAIELTPRGPVGLDVLDRALRDELDRLADEGPDPREVTFAAALLRSRIDAERKAAQRGPAAGGSWEGTSARVRELVDPGRAPRALAALSRVRAADVRDAARRVLSPRRRVVIVVRPEGAPATRAARE